MAWGDPGVSRKLYIEDGSQPWVVGGTPTQYRLQPSGILETLRMLTATTSTFTAGGGTGAVDVLSPGNYYTNITLGPAQQAPIIQYTGVGARFCEMMTSTEYSESILGYPVNTIPNSTLANAYNVTATSAFQNFGFRIPVAQKLRSIGGTVGFWPLNNPLVQMILAFTPNSSGTGPNYNVYSLTGTVAPVLVTGAATYTVASPVVTFVKYGWDTPQADTDAPPYNYTSSWIEESFQTNPSGATKLTWNSVPLQGLIARLGFYLIDGTTNNGVNPAYMTSPTAIQLVTGQLQPKIQESVYDASQRQEQYYGFDLPQGFFAYDFLGYDLTLQDVLNTNQLPNIQLQVTLSTGMGATNSSAKVLKQLIAPIVPMY